MMKKSKKECQYVHKYLFSKSQKDPDEWFLHPKELVFGCGDCGEENIELNKLEKQIAYKMYRSGAYYGNLEIKKRVLNSLEDQKNDVVNGKDCSF